MMIYDQEVLVGSRGHIGIDTEFPRALEIMENYPKKFGAWKNHRIWKNNNWKIMEFCEII